MAEVSEKDLLPGEVSEADLVPEGGAEGGAEGPSKPLMPVDKRDLGGVKDFAKSWANSAALGGGPQIAGAMGAAANAATHPFDPKSSDVDAYASVRNDTANDIAKSDATWAGLLGKTLGVFSTPGLPKPVAGATVPQRALQAAETGGLIGGLNAAFTSKADLTKADIENLKQFLSDTTTGVGAGEVTGGLVGAGLAAAEKPLRNTAEEQALRAAGLQAGIKNSVRKDLGAANMDEAREIGRGFLDEGLIPPIGSSEAVAKRASELQARAGNDIGETLREAEQAGSLDATQNANAVRKMLFGQSAVATDMSGQKASALADALEEQGNRTPGSFVGQNRAKSDAWKSANFSADAPMAAQLYRKAVGASRNDIEQQVASVLGPEKAAGLAKANASYGTAADALKLAENASTRSAAKTGIGPMKEALALLSGSVAGGAAGHPVAGAGAGLAGALGLKAYDTYGHSTAARFADFLANRSAANTGGNVGGRLSAEAWAKLLGEKEDKSHE